MESCLFCGTGDGVEVCADPFAQDVNNEEWIIPICDSCYQLRCDEI
ncbi:hypothetical protein [Kitasatospora sp. NPDC054795]